MKACMCLGAENTHYMEYKHEKEKLNEYTRRLRLILNTKLSAKKVNASNWNICNTSTKIQSRN